MLFAKHNVRFNFSLLPSIALIVYVEDQRIKQTLNNVGKLISQHTWTN